jgi:hypothetical protein
VANFSARSGTRFRRGREDCRKTESPGSRFRSLPRCNDPGPTWNAFGQVATGRSQSAAHAIRESHLDEGEKMNRWSVKWRRVQRRMWRKHICGSHTCDFMCPDRREAKHSDLRRLAAAAIMLAVVASCHSPAILGGATTDTTTHLCPDGLRCANYLDCPSLAGGDCEAPVDEPPAMREADAGQHCRMTMMGLVCLDERM